MYYFILIYSFFLLIYLFDIFMRYVDWLLAATSQHNA